MIAIRTGMNRWLTKCRQLDVWTLEVGTLGVGTLDVGTSGAFLSKV
jgi:hypothetical protein